MDLDDELKLFSKQVKKKFEEKQADINAEVKRVRERTAPVN